MCAVLALPLGVAVPAQENQVPAGEPAAAAWRTLRDGVADKDVEHRKKALTALGTMGPVPDAVRLAENSLQDGDTLVRQTAAAALGQMGSKQAVPYLKAALNDNPEVSFTAARALWALGDDSGREVFQEVIEGERKDTPGKLHTAMRDAKKRLRPPQLAMMGVREAAGVLGPAGIGVEAVQEALKESKKDSAVPGRVVAAEILAKDSDPYALTLLEWATGDDSWAVRLAVAKALGERGNQDSIPRLSPLLNDDRHAVRYMAAASIIKLQTKTESASK